LDFFKKRDVECYRSFDISSISSIGIGAVADFAVFPNTAEKLVTTVDFLTEANVPYFIAGRLTNVLFSSSEFCGVVVFTTKIATYSTAELNVRADTGVAFSKLLREISALSLGGAEGVYGIPGSVGGMVYNNAGAFGASVSDFFLRASLYSIKDKQVVTFNKAQMDFGYRKSILHNRNYIFLSGEFEFFRKEKKKIDEDFAGSVARRKATQPYGAKSLGSIFKRVDGIPVSKLIDDIGLKGFSVGGAEISKKHAGFIINTGGAVASDVLSLISTIKEKLYANYGIVAEEEIEIIN